MKTQIAEFLGKTAMATGLAATLAFGGGLSGLEAQQDDGGNFFDTQTVPAGARTGTTADPYAPVDLGSSSKGSLRLIGVDLGEAAGIGEAVDPCSPVRCKAW